MILVVCFSFTPLFSYFIFFKKTNYYYYYYYFLTNSSVSEWMRLLLPLAVERGTCIITNMGASKVKLIKIEVMTEF